MIEAAIFDLDGLLIDSEPLWQEVEYNTFKELGIEITPELRSTTYGLPVNELIHHWYNYKPWDDYNPDRLRYNIFDKVEEKILECGTALKGVEYILNYFKQKNIKTGIASASPYGIIYAALNKLNIRDSFYVINSGDEEKYGKPHPMVYLKTAERLNVDPINCIVFEDSLYGVIAAKAARMKVVAIPGGYEKNNPKYAIADLRLSSLADFTEKHFELLNAFC